MKTGNCRSHHSGREIDVPLAICLAEIGCGRGTEQVLREERSGEGILCQPASGSFAGATSAKGTKLRLGKRSCRGISKGTRDIQLRCSSPPEAESQDWHSVPAVSKAEGCHEEGCAICRSRRLSVGEEEAWSLGRGKAPCTTQQSLVLHELYHGTLVTFRDAFQ